MTATATATPDLATIISVIKQVAAIAEPPITATMLLTGRGADNRYHIARLRGIAGLILLARGIQKVRIAEAFRQDRNTTHNQMLTADGLANHSRYARYFPIGAKLKAES